MDLKEFGSVDPEGHWYYRSKLHALRREVERYAPAAKRFVDIGAGSAFFSRSLTPFDLGGSAVCVDPNYPSDSAERDGALRLVRSTPPVNADVYLFIDVLEHVEDDAGLLMEHTTAAEPGALALMTAPAFMRMWSGHDVFLGHYRRYTLAGLTEVVQRAGLEVLHARYLFGAIFPLAWVSRRLRRNGVPESDMKPVSAPVNALLTMLLAAEHTCRYNPFAGVTAFVVARVPPVAGVSQGSYTSGPHA